MAEAKGAIENLNLEISQRNDEVIELTKYKDHFNQLVNNNIIDSRGSALVQNSSDQKMNNQESEQIPATMSQLNLNCSDETTGKEVNKFGWRYNDE